MRLILTKFDVFRLFFLLLFYLYVNLISLNFLFFNELLSLNLKVFLSFFTLLLFLPI